MYNIIITNDSISIHDAFNCMYAEDLPSTLQAYLDCTREQFPTSTEWWNELITIGSTRFAHTDGWFSTLTYDATTKTFTLTDDPEPKQIVVKLHRYDKDGKRIDHAEFVAPTDHRFFDRIEEIIYILYEEEPVDRQWQNEMVCEKPVRLTYHMTLFSTMTYDSHTRTLTIKED